MDANRRRPITDEELDRVLRDALDVEPSASFVAGVHLRVADERRASWWSAWRVVVVAMPALALLYVGVRVWRMPDVVSPKPAAVLNATASAGLVPLPEAIAARAASVVTAAPRLPRLAAGASRPALPELSDVVISADEAAALRRLFRRVDAVADAAEPVLKEVIIPSISIAPLESGAVSGGTEK